MSRRRWLDCSARVIAALGALLRSLARCWVIAAVFASIMYLFAANDQGREGLIAATYETPLVFLFMIGFITLMTAYLLARFRVEVGREPASDATERFAREAAPSLIAVVCAFFLPLWLDGVGADELRRDPNVRSLSILFVVIALMSVFFGRLFDEFARPHGLWRERLARLSTALLAACGAGLGLLLQWPAWAVACATAAGMFFGAWIAARQAILRRGSEVDSLALRAGFGIVFAGMGLVAAWNHAKDPVVRIGTELGPFLVLWLVAGGWLGAAFFGVLLQEGLRNIRSAVLRRAALAIAGVVVVTLMALFLTGPFNEATVETVSPSVQAATQGAHLPSLEQYAEAWLERRAKAIREAPGRYPVILATAEGGGIRAAYWSATVLAGLQDKLPDFPDHLFAVSGVSGGSVGASVYVALLHRQLTEGASCKTARNQAACAAAVLSADLLSAPLFGALIGDVLRATFRSEAWPDRARILDGVLAAAWQKATGSDHMARPFHALWEDARQATVVPLLTPNATSAVDGRRTVLTPMALRSSYRPHADWRPEFSGSLSLASATLLSARFPFISPTALLPDSRGKLRLVDGGYADNSGAATALDLLRILMTAAEKKGLARRLMPLVLVIRNSPESAGESPETGGARGQFVGTLLDPVITLDNVRSLIAEHHQRELGAFVNEHHGLMEVRFRLRHHAEPYALGWMLSRGTRSRIDGQREQRLAEVVPDLGVLLQTADIP